MGKIVVTEFVSLDGVVEDPGGSEGSKHGAWTFEYDRGEDGDRFKLDELMEAEAQLLGRVTYEGFAAAWPKMEDEAGFAERMNGMPKYVFSATLEDPSWANTTVISGDLPTEIAKLKDAVDGNILVAGSVQLVHGLAEHDLIDELRLVLFPVVLGDGKRLFGATPDKRKFTLTDSKLAGDGIALLTYTRA
jgi:dihydrofolate reductase